MTNVHVHYRCYISNTLHKSTPGQLANGQHKCHMKRGLEFEKRLRIQKECGQLYNFCGAADYVGRGHSMFIIHHRAMKLCIHN